MTTKTLAKTIRKGETVLFLGTPHKVLFSRKVGDKQEIVLDSSPSEAFTWTLSRDAEVERLGLSAATMKARQTR